MDANEEESFAPRQLAKPESIKTSMQELWRKTCLLFWQHPLLLWSPLLVAEIAKYWIGIAQIHLSRAVIYNLLHHSVLSGQTDPPISSPHLATIALTAGVVTWISYALSFFLYSLALIFIANRVHKLTVRPDQIFRLQGTRIFAMASKLTLLLTCLSAAVALMFGWIVTILSMSPAHRNQFFPILLAVLASAASIFAAKPFLRTASWSKNVTQGFTFRTTVLAWLLLSGAFLASILLEFVFMHANISYPNHPSTSFNHLVGLTGSLITAMPYIPMMIGITLLAEDVRIEPHNPISESEAEPGAGLNLS